MFHALAPAQASGVDKGVAQCVPLSVLEATGKDGVQYLGGATAFLRARIGEGGRKNFQYFESSTGDRVLCTW